MSIVSAIKSAWGKFAAEFWRGCGEAWAESVARAQPALAGHPFEGQSEEEIKATLIRGTFDEGVQAERKRIGEIMAVPGASRFADLAVDLAVGGATAAQVAAVLSRTEVNVQARLHPTESSALESATPTLH